MATDAELRDRAVAELQLTTAGWRKPNGQANYPSGEAPLTTHWGKAMAVLNQIGAVLPPAPGPDPLPAHVANKGYGLDFVDDFLELNMDTWRLNAWYIPETPANFEIKPDIQLGAYVADQSGNTKYNYQAKDSIVSVINRPVDRKQRDLMTRDKSWLGGYFRMLGRYTQDVDAWASLWFMSDNWIRTADCSQKKVCEIDAFEAFHNLAGATWRSHSSTVHRNTAGNCGMPDEFKSPSWTQDCGSDLGYNWNWFGVDVDLATKTVTTDVNGKVCKSWPFYDSTNQPVRMFLGMWSHAYAKEVRLDVDRVEVWQK